MRTEKENNSLDTLILVVNDFENLLKSEELTKYITKELKEEGNNILESVSKDILGVLKEERLMFSEDEIDTLIKLIVDHEDKMVKFREKNLKISLRAGNIFGFLFASGLMYGLFKLLVFLLDNDIL